MVLRAAILAEFDRYQGDDDYALERSVKTIVKIVQEHRLAGGMEQLDVNDENVDETPNNDDDNIWQDVLDCAIGNSSRRITELLAHVCVALDETNLLDRLIAFSRCSSDAVRALATYMLSTWFNALVQLESHQSHETLEIIQQAVLVRCTDKAVAVRAETLHMECANDPDSLTARIFLLQHDPSANNRATAASRIPIELQTIDHLVYRIRDVKPAVRLAALRALEHAISLDAAQMAEIVHTGYTERYVIS